MKCHLIILQTASVYKERCSDASCQQNGPIEFLKPTRGNLLLVLNKVPHILLLLHLHQNNKLRAEGGGVDS